MSARVTDYRLLDAARAFQRLLRETDEANLDATFQVLAQEANDSTFARAYEPADGIALAIMAQHRRRALLAETEPEPEHHGADCGCDECAEAVADSAPDWRGPDV